MDGRRLSTGRPLGGAEGAIGVSDGREGFWRLEHRDLAALLARRDLSASELRTFLALGDLTRGYGRERGEVSLAQVGRLAGLQRRHVVRALRGLRAKGLYGQERTAGQAVCRWVVFPPVSADGSSPRAGADQVGSEFGHRETVPGAGNGGEPLDGDAAPGAGNPTVPEDGNTNGAGAAGTVPEAGNIAVPASGSSGVPSDGSGSVPKGGTLQERKKTRSGKKGRGRPGRPAPDPRVGEFLDWFAKTFERTRGTKYLVRRGKDGKLVRELLRDLDREGIDSLQELRGAAEGMLRDEWGRSKASIGLLAGQINQWRQAGRSMGGRGFARARSSEDYDRLSRRFDQDGATECRQQATTP